MFIIPLYQIPISIPMPDYILIVGQESNFQSRIILIPANEYFSVDARNNDFDILKQHSLKYHKMTVDNKDYFIDNLLIINFVNSSFPNSFKAETTEYTEICHKLIAYACGMEKDCYFDMDDKVWYDKAIIYPNEGFNHIKNYDKFKKSTNKINIIESFLILKTTNGKYNSPMFDTVDEMMRELYSK